MKKIIFLALFLIFLAALNYAADFSLGLFYGLRTVNDADIRHTYGHGYIYYPYISLNIVKGMFIGAGYEGGYSKEGRIGKYQEQTSLTVTGAEFFIGYQLGLKIISPYLKIGLGYFAYQQNIESPYVEGYKVDHKKTTVTVSGGFKVFHLNNFYLGAEVKYTPLKVKPYDYEVDLGGVRYLVGLGFRFKFK